MCAAVLDLSPPGSADPIDTSTAAYTTMPTMTNGQKSLQAAVIRFKAHVFRWFHGSTSIACPCLSA